MRKIILTMGLPASGKSTWAKEMLAKHQGQYKRINKDDLRAMLDDSKWSKANEKFVLQIRDTMVLSALNEGFNVIVDDTNLHPKHLQKMLDIAESYTEVMGKPCRVELEDFTHVPLDVCIERDSKRPSSVGRKVIKDMYKQFLKPEPVRVQYNGLLTDRVICDLDGTLALFGDKNPYDRNFEEDTVNVAVANIIEPYLRNEQVIFVSGRKETAREQTKRWLQKTFQISEPIYLFMRKADDNRKDVHVKKEIYETYIKGIHNVLFVLDDRDQVVEMWRQEGLTCLQVAEGDF